MLIGNGWKTAESELDVVKTSRTFFFRAALVPGCYQESGGRLQACGRAAAAGRSVCGWAASSGRGTGPEAAGREERPFAASPCRRRAPLATTLDAHRSADATLGGQDQQKHASDRYSCTLDQ